MEERKRGCLVNDVENEDRESRDDCEYDANDHDYEYDANDHDCGCYGRVNWENHLMRKVDGGNQNFRDCACLGCNLLVLASLPCALKLGVFDSTHKSSSVS